MPPPRAQAGRIGRAQALEVRPFACDALRWGAMRVILASAATRQVACAPAHRAPLHALRAWMRARARSSPTRPSAAVAPLHAGAPREVSRVPTLAGQRTTRTTHARVLTRIARRIRTTSSPPCVCRAAIRGARKVRRR